MIAIEKETHKDKSVSHPNATINPWGWGRLLDPLREREGGNGGEALPLFQWRQVRACLKEEKHHLSLSMYSTAEKLFLQMFKI